MGLLGLAAQYPLVSELCLDEEEKSGQKEKKIYRRA